MRATASPGFVMSYADTIIRCSVSAIAARAAVSSVSLDGRAHAVIALAARVTDAIARRVAQERGGRSMRVIRVTRRTCERTSVTRQTLASIPLPTRVTNVAVSVRGQRLSPHADIARYLH